MLLRNIRCYAVTSFISTTTTYVRNIQRHYDLHNQQYHKIRTNHQISLIINDSKMP